MSTTKDEDDTRSGSATAGGYSALQWREQPPTEPGWYWYRQKGTEEGVIAQVARHSTQGDLWLHTIRGGWEAPIEEDTEYEWAGPIPEPREPEATSAE